MVFSCVWFIYLLSIVIKVHHLNLYQYLIKIIIFNYQKKLHLKKVTQFNFNLSDNFITYLNKKYYVKQLVAQRLYKNVQEQLEQLIINPNLNANLIIIGISTNDLMQDYLSNLETIKVNEALTNYLTDHAKQVNKVNDISPKKQYFVLYEQDSSLNILNGLN
ncbi:hypothetical protein J6W20_01885 [bacterium]|nr:hypothetical protein [bacterium]